MGPNKTNQVFYIIFKINSLTNNDKKEDFFTVEYVSS